MSEQAPHVIPTIEQAPQPALDFSYAAERLHKDGTPNHELTAEQRSAAELVVGVHEHGELPEHMRKPNFRTNAYEKIQEVDTAKRHAQEALDRDNAITAARQAEEQVRFLEVAAPDIKRRVDAHMAKYTDAGLPTSETTRAGIQKRYETEAVNGRMAEIASKGGIGKLPEIRRQEEAAAAKARLHGHGQVGERLGLNHPQKFHKAKGIEATPSTGGLERPADVSPKDWLHMGTAQRYDAVHANYSLKMSGTLEVPPIPAPRTQPSHQHLNPKSDTTQPVGRNVVNEAAERPKKVVEADVLGRLSTKDAEDLQFAADISEGNGIPGVLTAVSTRLGLSKEERQAVIQAAQARVEQGQKQQPAEASTAQTGPWVPAAADEYTSRNHSNGSAKSPTAKQTETQQPEQTPAWPTEEQAAANEATNKTAATTPEVQRPEQESAQPSKQVSVEAPHQPKSTERMTDEEIEQHLIEAWRQAALGDNAASDAAHEKAIEGLQSLGMTAEEARRAAKNAYGSLNRQVNGEGSRPQPNAAGESAEAGKHAGPPTENETTMQIPPVGANETTMQIPRVKSQLDALKDRFNNGEELTAADRIELIKLLDAEDYGDDKNKAAAASAFAKEVYGTLSRQEKRQYRQDPTTPAAPKDKWKFRNPLRPKGSWWGADKWNEFEKTNEKLGVDANGRNLTDNPGVRQFMYDTNPNITDAERAERRNKVEELNGLRSNRKEQLRDRMDNILGSYNAIQDELNGGPKIQTAYALQYGLKVNGRGTISRASMLKRLQELEKDYKTVGSEGGEIVPMPIKRAAEVRRLVDFASQFRDSPDVNDDTRRALWAYGSQLDGNGMNHFDVGELFGSYSYVRPSTRRFFVLPGARREVTNIGTMLQNTVVRAQREIAAAQSLRQAPPRRPDRRQPEIPRPRVGV